SIGSLSWGETMRRPLGSKVRETQEPSPGCELRTSSTLKSFKVVRDSAGVAWPEAPGAGREAPKAGRALQSRAVKPSDSIPRRQKMNGLIIGSIAVRRCFAKTLQTSWPRQGLSTASRLPIDPGHVSRYAFGALRFMIAASAAKPAATAGVRLGDERLIK